MDELRVGFIGAGRISDLHALEKGGLISFPKLANLNIRSVTYHHNAKGNGFLLLGIG